MTDGFIRNAVIWVAFPGVIVYTYQKVCPIYHFDTKNHPIFIKFTIFKKALNLSPTFPPFNGWKNEVKIILFQRDIL